MPEISRFFGIVIAIYHKDHNPPHFHAKYGDETGVFSIDGLKMIEGSLPRRATLLVLEWAFEHRDELMQDWELAVSGKPLHRIDPLVYEGDMHFVKQAEYAGDYRVKLVFEDGSVRVADLGPHLEGEVFEPLKDVEFFKTLRVEPDLDTIVWDNGADMSPDFLYEISEKVAESSSAA